MRSTPAPSAAVRKFSASACSRRDPVRAFADAVHEEHGDVDVCHRVGQVAADVGADHLDVVAPDRGVELADVARGAPHTVTAAQELGDESTADVSRRSGDQHVTRSSRVVHRLWLPRLELGQRREACRRGGMRLRAYPAHAHDPVVAAGGVDPIRVTGIAVRDPDAHRAVVEREIVVVEVTGTSRDAVLEVRVDARARVHVVGVRGRTRTRAGLLERRQNSLQATCGSLISGDGSRCRRRQ